LNFLFTTQHSQSLCQYNTTDMMSDSEKIKKCLLKSNFGTCFVFKEENQ